MVFQKRFLDLYNFYSIQNKKTVINIKRENFYSRDEPRDWFLPCVIEKLKHNQGINLTEGYQRCDFIYIDDAVKRGAG